MKDRIHIKRYSPDFQSQWDSFVKQSFNATFLHRRAYMDYHADRFRDFSLIFFVGEEPVALMPAHRHEDKLWAHRGLTYGGWLWKKPFRTAVMIEMWQAMRRFLRREGIRRWCIRDIPPFYAAFMAGNNRYVYRRMGGRPRPVDFWIIDTRRPPDGLLNADRRRSLRRAGNLSLSIERSEKWEEFWSLLENSLQERHASRPVHTLREIRQLHARFPAHIHLVTARQGGELVAGAVVYETARVARLQYLAGVADEALRPAIDALVWHIIRDYYPQKGFIDLGSALLPDGTPHESLIYWKESFGATPAVQYRWDFDVDNT